MSLTKGNGMKGNEHSVFTQKVVKVTLNSNQTDPWHHVIREVDSIVPPPHPVWSLSLSMTFLHKF